MNSKYQAPTVKKAFQILALVSDSDHEGLGISELSKTLGMSKGTVHGITTALEELGVVVRDPSSKRYTLGLTLFELGRLAHAHFDLKDTARPFMEDLMRRSRASVFLGILSRDHVTILDIVEADQDLKITSPIGTTIPLLAGAVGKVFLAHMDKGRAEGIIASKGLTRFTENAVMDVERYQEALERVRESGYATDDEEYLMGVRAVASPIRGGGHLMAAIWVVGFKAALDDETMIRLGEHTRRTAEAISRSIEEQAGR